jgi:hypothetical protein
VARPAAPDAVRAPVSSDVPVLVMAGAFDGATAPGFQRSVYFHPPTGTSIVVLTNLLLAPNTYFPEALPAERITQLVQQAVIEG